VYLKRNQMRLYLNIEIESIMKNLLQCGIKENKLQRRGNKRGEKIMNSNGTNFELVGDFMEAFGQDVLVEPTWPDRAVRELRVDLIQEEVDELVEAITNKDMVEIADALTDILYVVYGAGHTFGIDLDECFTEVHASNMSKLGEDGTPIKAENGKVMKGPGFFAPDLESILNQ